MSDTHSFRRKLSSCTISLIIFSIAALCTLHFKHKHHRRILIINEPSAVSVESARMHINYSSFHPNFSLIPYRNDSIKSIAWQKFRNGSGKIRVIHARKAGGTTIRHWMHSIVKENKKKRNSSWNCSVHPHEFWTYLHRDNENAMDTIFKANPYSIYVMAFRHPIERILSQYDFEWRWGCYHCSYQSEMAHDKQSELSERTFMKYEKKPTYDDSSRQHLLTQYKKHKISNIELDELLLRVDKYQNLNKSELKYKIAFNAYINNYYLWMFCCNHKKCNIYKDFVLTGLIDECMEHAMKMIMSFDIVLIDEWINDLRTQTYVNQLLLGNMSFIGMDKAFKKPNKRAIVTKRGKNLMIQQQVYEKLEKLNSWDLKLYDFVKRLSFERITTNMDI